MRIDERLLLEAAYEASAHAYAPYSGFSVGAALLCASGRVYTGCTVENASFGLTNCAERSAIFSAVSAGEREFAAIAVVGGKNGEKMQACPPCGACRQVLAEFCDRDLPVILTDGERVLRYSLEALLPCAFDANSL